MPRKHLSYTAMSGGSFADDAALTAIVTGANVTAFANTGAFKEHHLRVIVTMPRTPLYLIRMIASEPGTHPEKAIDYCVSRKMARTLLQICGDATCFWLYNQAPFVCGEPLHDDRKGADRFRNRKVVYEVLCERVLYGGKVLPPHVAKWFVAHGNNMQYAYMLKHGSNHMMSCYDTYEKQAFEQTEELVGPASYAFMLAYHRYSKYLPLIMYIFLTSEVKTPEKRRKVKSRELYDVVQRVLGLGCCEKYILSFL